MTIFVTKDNAIKHPSKTWQPTTELRWNAVNYDGPNPVLEQGWYCLETGEVEWKPIEYYRG